MSQSTRGLPLQCLDGVTIATALVVLCGAQASAGPVSSATLEQITPVAATYETGAFTGTGFGAVTGPVIPVDINLTPPRVNTSGCEAADFAGLDFSGPNDIVLIQRGGGCSFFVAAANAEAAGAEAAIIFNQGDLPTREGLFIGTLAPAVVGIPVVGASFADGVALAQTGSTALIEVAETPTATPTATPTDTPTSTPTATPTETRVPVGGACQQTDQCTTGLVCVEQSCTASAPAPAASNRALVVMLIIVTLIGGFSILRRNSFSNP